MVLFRKLSVCHTSQHTSTSADSHNVLGYRFDQRYRPSHCPRRRSMYLPFVAGMERGSAVWTRRVVRHGDIAGPAERQRLRPSQKTKTKMEMEMQMEMRSVPLPERPSIRRTAHTRQPLLPDLCLCLAAMRCIAHLLNANTNTRLCLFFDFYLPTAS